MSGKVKVSREVAEVLDEVRNCHQPTIDDFIKRHALGDVGPDWSVLKQYRTLFVAHLIYTGDYEIKQTPEEIVFEQYKRRRELMKIGNELKPVHEAYAEGIEFVLDTLNIKIDGINK